MTYIHYHNIATLVPQYGFDILNITDETMTIAQLIELLQTKLRLHNVPLQVYNILNRQNFKYSWSYNKYVPKSSSLELLESDDIVTNYEYILVNYDHSQHNEDHVINQIFDIIGTTNKYCIEIGSGDGKFTSNTIVLRHQGWNGLLLDSKDQPNHELINAKYIKQHVAHSNIVRILENNNVPASFDYLSIDIDSHDYHIWDSIDIFRPRVVCIEVDAEYRFDEYVRPHTDSSRTRKSSASIISMTKLATSKNYSLIYNNGGNAFYVVNEEFNKFKLFTIKSRIAKFQQTYDKMKLEESYTYSVRNNVERKNYMKIIETYLNQDNTGYNNLFIETMDFL
jgi:hypothetical protein